MTNTACSSIVEAAQHYTRRGFFVVPIPPGTNHPILPSWQDLRLAKGEVSKYFDEADGIGLLLDPSNLIDVDCDCGEAVAAARVLLPPTEMVHGRKSNPSSHWYFRPLVPGPSLKFADPRGKSNQSGRAMLIELRTKGQTVVPPSTNAKSGEQVQWESEGEPAEVDYSVLSQNVARVASAALLARYWPSNQRHFAALALSGMLLHGGWTQHAAEKLVMAVAIASGDEEADARVSDVSDTAKRFAEGKPVTGAPTLAEIIGDDIVAAVREWLELQNTGSGSDFHYTDLGNARRLVKFYGQDLKFHNDAGKWLIWNGQLWAADVTGEIERSAKRNVQGLHDDAAQLTGKAFKQAVKHAGKSESEARLKAMVNVAKTEPDIIITSQALDADPWQLNCSNGTLDLRTGRSVSHHRDNLCTKLAPVEFDRYATCPTWDAFLDRIMAGNSGLIQFLRRAIGYSLTGITTEHVLFFLYGTGANGKSTFVETIRQLFGGYALQADFTTFLEKRNDGPRNDLARLRGARFVAAVEAAQGRQLAENVIKQLTGGDVVSARYLFHEYFEFLPQFKIFLVANHKPVVKGTEEAIWRRIRLIPFMVTIPESERDKQLLRKLQAELPGILAWAVRGCLEWQKMGLGEPPEVSTATEEYRDEMDVVGHFIEDRCSIEKGKVSYAGDLYDDFKRWCEGNGEAPLSQKLFGTQLRERGYISKKHQGKRAWAGISCGYKSNVDGSDGSDA